MLISVSSASRLLCEHCKKMVGTSWISMLKVKSQVHQHSTPTTLPLIVLKEGEILVTQPQDATVKSVSYPTSTEKFSAVFTYKLHVEAFT